MNAPVAYIGDFVPAETASTWFARLWNELDWERRPTAPRREYWTNVFGRSYTYGSGAGIRTYESRSDHELIVEIRTKLGQDCGHFLEGCFLNGYENGRDALGWHADDDPGIDHSKPIAIVTLYDEPTVAPIGKNKGKSAFGRTIEFKEQTPGSVPESLFLEHGSLALMGAGMQSTHYHRIPKAMTGFEPRPRISLTFRGLK